MTSLFWLTPSSLRHFCYFFVLLLCYFALHKNMFSVKDFFSKCGQIPRKLRIWSHLLNKSLMENFIFCAALSSNSINFFIHSLKLLSIYFLFNFKPGIKLSTLRHIFRFANKLMQILYVKIY